MKLENNNHPESGYRRQVLFSADAFEVATIDWTQDAVSVLHNHGWSQCQVLIEEGVFENKLETGLKSEVQIFEKGQVLSIPVGAAHEISCRSFKGKTLHVYTPKIIERSDFGTFTAPQMDSLRSAIELSKPTSTQQLKEILDLIRQNSISTHSPYFMNQLFSGISPQLLLSQELISQTKTTLATFEASPAFSTIEMEVIQKLGKLIGWQDQKTEGISVPGGSAANFMALHCARQKLRPAFKTTGMSGESFRIYVSREAHYSIKKACVVLGFGKDALVEVPADANGKMQPAALQKLIESDRQRGQVPLIVVATAGTTVLGAFDPLEEISQICNSHGIWLHVDAAWGGPALFSPRLRHLLKGSELADSFTFDAHKLFGASLPTSFFLTPHRGILMAANDVSGGDYLFHSGGLEQDSGKMSWQCGRGADSCSFWTIWKSLGTAGLGDFVDSLLEIQNESRQWIQGHPRLQLVGQPEYLNLCVRILPPAGRSADSHWSTKVREKMKNLNLAMVNYSEDENGSFLRLILSHPNLQTSHIRQILQWSLEMDEVLS